MIDEKKLIEDLEYFISHTTEEMPEHYAYMRFKWLIEKQPKISLENKTSDNMNSSCSGQVWIPVEEALPETDDELILVTTKELRVEKSFYYNGKFIYYHDEIGYIDWWFDDGDEVIAWQPLPKPYEVEDESN